VGRPSARQVRRPGEAFDWDTLIAVGIGIAAFAWGVASGFDTDQMKAIIGATDTNAGPEASLARPPAGPESGG
jgi:hypothetical protein